MTPEQTQIRTECVRAAGQALARALAELDTTPIDLAVDRAYRSGGPPKAELRRRILARRGIAEH